MTDFEVRTVEKLATLEANVRSLAEILEARSKEDLQWRQETKREWKDLIENTRNVYRDIDNIVGTQAIHTTQIKELTEKVELNTEYRENQLITFRNFKWLAGFLGLTTLTNVIFVINEIIKYTQNGQT